LINKRHRTVSICFIGIDGSGKTTQANLLLQMLRRQGKSVKYVHFFSPKRIIAGGLQPKLFINTFIKILDQPANNRLETVIKVVLRLMCILIDAWLMYFVNIIKYKGKIIIYDRYYYDSIVAIALRYTSLVNPIITFSKLLPKPSIIILLEVSSKTAIQRKPEHTHKEAERICYLYRQLKGLLPTSVINAELEIEQIKQHIEKLCKDLITCI